MEKTKKKINIIIASLAILCFQVLYYQLTVVLLQKTAEVLPGLSNDCYLIIHHTYEFLIVFLLTLLIIKFKDIDFGYHNKDWKKGLLWCGLAIVYSIILKIVLNLINDNWGIHFKVDSFIFQLFFSGLGEEILFRAIPLAILPLVWGGELSVNVGKKHKIFIDILISAMFFSLAHIQFQFGASGINYSWIQLGNAFVMGIFIGMVYKKTNSVWLCMILHGIVNIVATVL